ncbi:hypothetical protein M413DRAFT_193698 [Hebeloma cylindrosporum]|uniref:Uncharacterized protein n=1 Tax=Hebeloma cylindrosporum TaxID=76867 RepID=A0A0C3C5W1_HEBCY|nr:hypothetical protein M413DRAFT_193698 [Hebeloma cylindrosporum h7]
MVRHSISGPRSSVSPIAQAIKKYLACMQSGAKQHAAAPKTDALYRCLERLLCAYRMAGLMGLNISRQAPTQLQPRDITTERLQRLRLGTRMRRGRATKQPYGQISLLRRHPTN